MTTTGRRAATAAGAARALRHGLPALAALSLACASPAEAGGQLGDFIKGVMPQMPGSKPKPDVKADGKPGEPGAMSLQGPTPMPPLHKLGTDAVAVVESVSGATAVRPMDYVFAKQTISLGPRGALTMSYLSGCLTEVIQGGVVTVALRGSTVTGGKLQARATPGCKAASPIILASASEAGATVNRITTPFSGVNWEERALKAGPPTFKWDKALGVATIRVKDMDKEGEPVVWEVAAAAGQEWVTYPLKAAPLAPHEPFKVEAVAGGKVVAGALFSIDPGLDVADNLANRLVPLSAP
jgi:hypothetical protein